MSHPTTHPPAGSAAPPHTNAASSAGPEPAANTPLSAHDVRVSICLRVCCHCRKEQPLYPLCVPTAALLLNDQHLTKPIPPLSLTNHRRRPRQLTPRLAPPPPRTTPRQVAAVSAAHAINMAPQIRPDSFMSFIFDSRPQAYKCRFHPTPLQMYEEGEIENPLYELD